MAFLQTWQGQWAEAVAERECLRVTSTELYLGVGFLAILAIGSIGQVMVLSCRSPPPVVVAQPAQLAPRSSGGQAGLRRPEGLGRSVEAHPLRTRRIRHEAGGTAV